MCVVSVGEKFLFWSMVVVEVVIWFVVGRLVVGRGFSLYLQGVYQYLIAGFGYYVFNVFMELENC